mgnify:CR=1 FL=1
MLLSRKGHIRKREKPLPKKSGAEVIDDERVSDRHGMVSLQRLRKADTTA